MEKFDCIPKLSEMIAALTGTFGCSGRETAVENKIRKFLPDWIAPEDVQTDPLGNLIVRMGTKAGKRKILLDAHMDSIGLALTEQESERCWRFRSVGFIMPSTILGQSVLFENGAVGRVICSKDKAENLTLTDLRINLEEGTAQIGQMCCFVPSIQQDGDLLTGTFLDNRAGCAALLRAMYEMKDTPNQIYCVFSVQEEVGMRGAALAAAQICPDLAFSVDMGVAGDFPGAVMNTHVRLGGGVIEKMMDDSIICHPVALQKLEEAAQRANVPLMRLVGGAGYTNAGGIHLSGKGVPTGILGIPTRKIHTPMETVCIKDVDSCAKVLAQLAYSE